MKSRSWKRVTGGLLVAGLFATSLFCLASDEPPSKPQSPPPANSGLYLKVQLGTPLKLSKLKPGDVVEGSLVRDVYSSDRELFLAGSHVRLTVDSLEKRRRARNDHWPWVVNVFTPRHEKYPVFKTASVSSANGESPLQVSVVSISRRREVHAQAKKKGSGQNSNEPGVVETSKAGGVAASTNAKAPTMVLEAIGLDSQKPLSSDAETPETPNMSGLEALPAGTVCKILLMGDVSASKSNPGDTIQGRLLEPVRLNSRVVLPAGSLFEGKVVKKTPPRWGSRAGSLALTFTGVTVPGGNLMPIAASLAGAELDQASHTKIDAEGQLRGEHPGKAWMAINIGVSAGLAKVSDDTLQLIIETIVSTATDVSTAGSGRIAAACVSGIFMVSRHGRDVVLPRFTEMNISLDRPLSLTQTADSAAPVTAAHGD